MPRLEWDILKNLDAVRTQTCSVMYGYIHKYRSLLDKLQDCLTSEELHRADRFRFATDRTRFIVRRGVLRTVLAERLHCSPPAVTFSYSQFGKPELSVAGRDALSFNSTASGNMFAIAISHLPIGIDIERINSDVDMLAIADRFLPQPVAERLHSIEPEKRPTLFFKCWTRTEAYIKARGLGLRHLAPDLMSLDTFVDRAGRTFCEEGGKKRGEIEDLVLADDYAAAVATLVA